MKLDLIENLEAFIFISAGSVLSFAIAQSLDAFKRESSPELLAPLFLVAATIGFVSLWRSVWGDVRREPVIYATVSLLFGFVAFAALETGLVADSYWPPVAEGVPVLLSLSWVADVDVCARASGATKLNHVLSPQLRRMCHPLGVNHVCSLMRLLQSSTVTLSRWRP